MEPMCRDEVVERFPLASLVAEVAPVTPEITTPGAICMLADVAVPLAVIARALATTVATAELDAAPSPRPADPVTLVVEALASRWTPGRSTDASFSPSSAVTWSG
jgi:hypothetical protein